MEEIVAPRPTEITPTQATTNAIAKFLEDNFSEVRVDIRRSWATELQDLPNFTHLSPQMTSLSFILIERKVALTNAALTNFIRKNVPLFPKFTEDKLIPYKAELVRYATLIKKHRETIAAEIAELEGTREL